MVDMVAFPKVTVEGRLRARNQVTIPDEIVRLLGLEEGARLIFRTDGDTIEIRRLRDSYFGALPGVWPEGSTAFVRAERDSWKR